jgi:hypothetical protein
MSAGLFVYGCHRQFAANGIESSILVCNTLLAWSLIKTVSARRTAWFLLAGGAALLAVLVRPTLLPALAILLLWTAVAAVRRRPAPDRRYLLSYAILCGGLLAAAGLSYRGHRDFRYLTGTYSSIPVYGAFNGYLRLDAQFDDAGVWDRLPPAQRELAMKPLALTSTWQARERALRAEIATFIRQHPGRALAGMWWRLKSYTFWNRNDRYQAYFWLSCLSFIGLLLWRPPGSEQPRRLAALGLGLALWIILMKLLFVYTDNRYTVDLMPYLLYPVIELASLVRARCRRAAGQSTNTTSSTRRRGIGT